MLRRSVEEWNDWRDANPDITNIDLAGVDLSNLNLAGVNFSGVRLVGANLRYTTLDFASLQSADVTGAQFHGTSLKCICSCGCRGIPHEIRLKLLADIIKRWDDKQVLD